MSFSSVFPERCRPTVCKRKPHEVRGTSWGRADLKDVDDANLGLKGSPTKIAKASDKVRKGAGEKVNPDSPEEAVSYIVGKLTEKHMI